MFLGVFKPTYHSPITITFAFSGMLRDAARVALALRVDGTPQTSCPIVSDRSIDDVGTSYETAFSSARV